MTTISHADITSERSTPAAAEKQKILNRLRRLEGQVRGLHKMVDEDRDCQEILTLLAGIKSALNASGDVIFETYLDRCQQRDQPVPAGEILRVARLLR
jgi:CsoR family transcriptional regulator, copper-sensing transcriptional repressor